MAATESLFQQLSASLRERFTKNSPPKLRDFRRLVQAAQSRQEVDTVFQLQHEYHKRFRPLDRHTWTVMVEACLRAGARERIVDVLRRPGEYGWPGLLTSAALRKVVPQVSSVEELDRFVESCREGKVLRARLTSDVLRRYLQLGDVSRAEALVRSCPPETVRPSHFTAVAWALHREQQRDKLEGLVAVMQAASCAPNVGLKKLLQANAAVGGG
ncbi:hypothetical protein CDCA_CDCA10G2942 [Cyanidium caldarium]|uniref:Uncharacterized protein n=1 Tax=Cyanidium caldarium TaxID=2771 RepID=A0AAV9IXB9_CYACA|nr:hypothetical protein CDCA_CDCA10G2942 [Cyanidium caldarium]